MVKDEDVCLHCGLCAERCPTGAWDMQKFLLDMTARRRAAAAHARQRASSIARQRLRRQVRQRQRLGLGVAPTGCSPSRSCAWACRSRRATSSRRTSRACRPGTRCASPRPGYLGRRGGVDLMVAMNPQTWDKDVAEIEPGGYLFYDSTKPLPPSKFRDDITVLGVPLTAICNDALHRPAPAPAVQEHHLRRRARRRCSASSPAVIETLLAEQFKGKDKLIARQHRGAAHGPRLRAASTSTPLGLQVRSGRRGRRPHLRRGQRRRRRSARSMAARRSAPGIRSRRRPRWPRPSRSYCEQLRDRPGDRQGRATPSSRPRTSSPRSAS